MKLNKLAIGIFALSSIGAIAAANNTSSDSSQSSNPGYVSSQSRLSAQGDSSQVSQVQQALAAKGYDAGPADGQMGPKTKTALKQFQQSQGLQASGQLDNQTLAALGTGSSTTTPSSQPQDSSPQSTPQQGSSGFSPQSPPPGNAPS